MLSATVRADPQAEPTVLLSLERATYWQNTELMFALCMQTHKQSLLRKLQERQVEVQSKQEQLSSILAESDAMRGVIAAQTVNKDDVARMNQEK